jgi:hypothetical protein
MCIRDRHNSESLQMIPGYADDFTFDLGWSVATTASTGSWERGEPIGTTNAATQSNPDVDVSGDCMDKCYVTGNAGGTASQDDVDNGSTTLTSPVFNISAMTNPWIHYNRWFYNAGGSGNPNDSLIISLTDGNTTAVLETVLASTAGSSTWVPKNYRVLNYFTPGANMRLIVRTADASPGHIVEAGFDNFSIADSSALGMSNVVLNNGISIYPNPFNGTTTVHFAMDATPVTGAYIEVKDVTGRIISTQAVNQQEGTVEVGQNLSSGLYFVQLVNGTQTSAAVRIIKTK